VGSSVTVIRNFKILYSVDLAAPYNVVNETNLEHNLFSVYFDNFIYNLYMFRTSPGPSSGQRTVFHVTLSTCVLYSRLSGMQDGSYIPSGIPDGQLYTTQVPIVT